MFDAAASATASEVATEQVAQEQAEAAVSSDSAGSDGQTADQAESQGVLEAIATYNPGESRSEVVFVDPTVPNYQELLAGMDPHIDVVMLDGGTDGMHQMASVLEGRTGIDAIHIISHGSAGELHLGTGTLSTESMSNQYAQDLATIQTALSEQADILVYGCEFAKGDAGQAAVDMLAQLTGGDVQASTDLTGSISLGGDWEFEVSTGTIETSLAIDYDAQMNWAGILGTETVADTFSDKSYGNNDGTQSWSSKWSEVDVGASDANGGHIKVNSGELRIETQKAGASVSRGVDLSGVSSATLSSDYENDLDKGGSVDIRISTDGGKSYTTLDGGTFSSSDNTGSGTVKFDISSYASADTKIQFVVTGTSGGDRLFVDNVQISYDVGVVNQAPTDLALSANSVAENATTGTVVGTVTGTDSDASDTKTYSLTDTAGGRFAINASTGVITVADGSLLNYEASTSHSITVRVTDSGGLIYDKTFSIGVSNVNEAPTNITLTGNSVAENTATGTVVGTAAGSDADAGDTKTYSLTDTAGGRFVINASTGQLTVADGSLLNYEANARHSVTVRVTDAGGLTFDETFSIGVSDVNEAPSVVDPVVMEPVVEVTADPDPISVDPVGTEPVVEVPGESEPIVEVVAGPEPVVDPVAIDPMVEVAADHDPIIVDPVGTEPVVEMTGEPDSIVEVVAGPVPVIDPVVPEPVEVAGGPAPIIDPVMTEPVVEVAVEPDPIVVDPGVTEPVVEVAMDPVPVVEVAMDPVPVVEMTVGPTPAVEMTVEPEPVVEITVGPGPVAKPVVTEQLRGAPNVNVGNVKMSGPAAEQALVASLHQQASAGPDRTSPLSSSQGPLSDFGVGGGDAANTADKMVDGQSEPVVTMDSTAPSKTSSPIDQKGIAEETAVSGKGGTLFSSSGSKVGAADNLDSRRTQDPAQFAFGQVTWPLAEETEKVPEDSGDLAMPMVAGLVGAALQGSLRKKEKMTTMHGDLPSGDQEVENDQTSREPSADDKEMPPRAA